MNKALNSLSYSVASKNRWQKKGGGRQRFYEIMSRVQTVNMKHI